MFRWLVPRHQAKVRRNDTDESYGCRDNAWQMTPQRPTRLNVQNWPTHTPSTRHRDVHNLSAGLESDGWRRSYTNSLPQYCLRGTGDCQPSDPSRCTPQEARRLVAFEVAALAKGNKTTTTSPARRATASSRHGRARQESFAGWPDIPPTWELECDARSHSGFTQTFQIARDVISPSSSHVATSCCPRGFPSAVQPAPCWLQRCRQLSRQRHSFGFSRRVGARRPTSRSPRSDRR